MREAIDEFNDLSRRVNLSDVSSQDMFLAGWAMGATAALEEMGSAEKQPTTGKAQNAADIKDGV
jgi:hypothetical protein